MIYDRPYMTASSEERAKKTLMWLIGITIGVFVLQNMMHVSGASRFLEDTFGLSFEALGNGYVWTLLTYAFLHDRDQYLHIVINLIFIYLLGSRIMQVTGTRRFLQLYLFSALCGGLLYLAVGLFAAKGTVIGASGVWYGLLAFFVMLAPEEEVLFMFVLRVKRKIIAYIMLGIGLMGLIFQELLGSGYYTAHSAHLGGMLGGYLFFRFVFAKNPYDNGRGLSFSLPNIFKKKPTPKRTENFRYSVNLTQPKDLKQEVDRILDKINSKGFGSLSAAEKKVLDDARELLRRR